MVTSIIGRIKEGVILTFKALRSEETAKDVGKEFAKVVPFLDKLTELSEKTGEIVEKNEIVRFYKTIRDASEKAGIGDAEINFREFIDKLKEEFEKFKPEKWSGDPIDVPGATLVLEIVEVKDDRKAKILLPFSQAIHRELQGLLRRIKNKRWRNKISEKT